MSYPDITTMDQLLAAIDQYLTSPRRPPLKGADFHYLLAGVVSQLIKYSDAGDKTITDRKTVSYFPIAYGDTGISSDNGRFTYQNDVLIGLTGYIVEPLQLGKLNPVSGLQVSYNQTAGSFTILVPGFVLNDDSAIIVWLGNFVPDASGGGTDPSNPNSVFPFIFPFILS